VRVKSYQAGEIGAALEKVKEDLGPDAVILSTQRIQPSTGEWRGPIVEVMAGLGSDLRPTGMHFFQRKSPGIPHVRIQADANGCHRPAGMKIEVEQLLGPRLDNYEAAYALVDEDLEEVADVVADIDPAVLAVLNEQLGVTQEVTEPDVGTLATTNQYFSVPKDSMATTRTDVRARSRAHATTQADVPATLRSGGPPPLPPKAARRAGANAYSRGGHSDMFQPADDGSPDGVVITDQAEGLGRDSMLQVEQWLEAANLSTALQTTMMAGVRARIGSALPSRDVAERALIDEIVRHIQVRSRSELDARRLVAFVGPTGVGKTTTVAKLAAEYTVDQRRRVGLLTIDTYRVGAVEQLSRYAALLEVPLEVVADRSGLERSLRRLEDCDLVLVDTIGRSPREPRPARGLAELFEGIPGISFELCVSATTSLHDMRGILRSYAEISCDNLLFTKLDETFAMGPLMSAHIEEALPLSYFTTGQRVPDDIERASVERVIGMMIPFE
jgi:flagellar biosynthesis protein FlhF